MELFADRFWQASLDTDAVLHLTRTAEHAELTLMRKSLDALSAALRQASEQHSIRGILLDMREARPRNDAEFEDMTTHYRHELEGAFERIAMLVKTEVGKLQVSRLDRELGTKSHVFDDLADAMAFLKS